MVVCEKTKALREGANVMLIIGCDFHPGFQQIAIFDNRTGAYEERRLSHRAEAEQFYRSLARILAASPSHKIGQRSRRKAGGDAARQRTFSLFPDETGAGSAGRGFACVEV